MLPKDIRVVGFYVKADDKTRMLRQLNRETNPDVREIVRRFTADEEDFYDIDNDPDYPVNIVNNGSEINILQIVSALNEFLHPIVSSGRK
jgi:guanylate kinase